jgi:hypothetical protein
MGKKCKEIEDVFVIQGNSKLLREKRKEYIIPQDSYQIWSRIDKTSTYVGEVYIISFN